MKPTLLRLLRRDWRVEGAAALYLFFFPLFGFNVRQQDTAVFFVYLPFHALFAAALLLWLAASAEARQGLSRLPRPVLALLAAHAVIGFLPRAGLPGTPLSFQGSIDQLYAAATLLLFALPMAAAARRRLLAALAVLGGLEAVFVLVLRQLGRTQFVALASNPDINAALLLVSLPAALVSFRPPVRVALALVILAGIVRTDSRAALVALAAGVLVAALATWPRRALPILATAGVAGIAALPLLVGRVLPREARVEMWRGTWRLALDYPLLGVGPGRFIALFPSYRGAAYFDRGGVADVTIDPHCHWLRVLAEQGFPGLGIWLALLVAVLLASHRLGRDPGRRALQMAVLLLLVQNTFDQNLGLLIGKTWLALLLGAALATEPATARVGPGGGRSPRAATLLLAAVGTIGALANLQAQVVRPLRASYSFYRALRTETPEDGVELLYRATTLWPQEPRFAWYFALGVARVAGPRPALDAYDRLAAITPDYAHIHHNRANLLARLGEREAAIAEMEREVELFPRDRNARALLAALRSAPRP